MRLNIKERCQKVLQCLREKTQQSIRAIARATGIPKSSVHRQLMAIKGRQQYAPVVLVVNGGGGALAEIAGIWG